MTLTTDHNWIAYTAGAAQTVFPYDFLVPAATDLTVYVDRVLQPTVNYTVSGVGVGAGGNVTLASATVGGEIVLLLRATDDTQQVNLVEGDKLPAETVEDIFDKVAAAVQDIRETATRAFGLPVSRAGDAPTMPDFDDTAIWGKALKVNATGDGLDVFTVLASDIASPITSKGDLIQGSNTNTPERLPIGSAAQVLTVSGGKAAWGTPVTGISATLIDAKGDLLVGTAADTAARKAVGTTGAALLADPSTSDGLVWLLGAALHGRVRLRYNSATQIELVQRDGQTLYVNDANGWRLRSIGTGITAANTSVFVDGTGASNLAADTTYLVCLFDDSGTLKADFRTTLTHVPDADIGVEIATGLPTRTVVGMVRTNVSTQFQDNDAARGVRSWFYDGGVGVRKAITADRTTASTTFVHLNAEARVSLLLWAGEVLLGSVSGEAVAGSANQDLRTGIGVDSTTVPEPGANATEVNDSGDVTNISVAMLKTGVAEGWHEVNICVNVNTGTGTWEGTTSPRVVTLNVLTVRR